MSAHPLGSATLSFGLVSVPIKMFSTGESSAAISFNWLHKKDGARLKQQYVCSKDGDKVEKDEMVKGYEFTKGQYVIFSPEELKALEEKSTNTVEITEFVPADQVDRKYVEKSYFLGPDKGGDRAYRLLAEALKQTERVAVGQYAARGKQYLIAVRPEANGLVMEQLRYANEIRSIADVPIPKIEVKKPELQLAVQLVEQAASAAFQPDKYEDNVRKRVLEQILHQVDDLRLGRLGRLLGDLLALHLPLNLLEHPLADVVLVLVRLKGCGRRLLHQLHRELQLRLLHLDLWDGHVGDRTNLVRVAQLLHDEPARFGTHGDEVLLAARRVLSYRHAPGLLQRLRQQTIGPVATLVGAEEIRLLDVFPVDLVRWHEFSDLDCVGGLLLEGLQLLRIEDHVLPLRELVALHHLVLLDLVAVLGAHVLLLQACAILLVQPVEAAGGRRLAGREQFDRHGNEAQGQRGGTKRVCAHGLRFHPYAGKTEARARSAQSLPCQAVVGPHAGARGPSRDRSPLRRRPVRRPHACRPAASLGPAPRDGRRAQVLGGPEGPLAQSCRQAARGPRGRPPARVRRLRGDHPRRQLWRGRRDRVGPRSLGTARRPS